MEPFWTEQGAGQLAHMGSVDMRLLLPSAQTGSALSVGEFSGTAGPWTVPHKHVGIDEFFYVVEGVFQFSCGDQELEAKPGSLLMVPRGTSHVFTAETDGKVIVIWTPGGLEQMFLELSGVSITDKDARAAISSRWDSVPV